MVPASRSSGPLDARWGRSAGGWVVRVGVHAERVTVSKEVVVYERVVLRRNVVDDAILVEAVVQREQLRVESDVEVELVYSGELDSATPHH